MSNEEIDAGLRRMTGGGLSVTCRNRLHTTAAPHPCDTSRQKLKHGWRNVVVKSQVWPSPSKSSENLEGESWENKIQRPKIPWHKN
jgi:hypothetical protein